MIIITIFNNSEVFKAGLLSSHPAILGNTRIVAVDNRNGVFTSFSQALQSVLAKLPEEEALVIAHQDVQFYAEDTLLDVSAALQVIGKDGCYLAGLVGVGKFKRRSEEAGVNPIISAGKMIPYQKIDQPVRVETFDECVIITNKKTIAKYSLFRDQCVRWHLYAVDACLSVQEGGLATFVLPVPVNHFSTGKIDYQYLLNASYLLRKHKKKHIYTTNLHISRLRIMKAYFKMSCRMLLQLIKH